MSSILSKITSAFSGDLLFILVLFVILFICTMYFGKNQAVAVILSFYPATFLYNNFPFLDKLLLLNGDKGIVINKLLIFLLFFVLVNYVIRKHFSSYAGESSTFQKGALAFGIMILIVLFSYSTVSLDIIHSFSDSIDVLFSDASRAFWWSLAPLVILIFV